MEPPREFDAIGDYWGKRDFWFKKRDADKLRAATHQVRGQEWFPDSGDFTNIEKAGRRPRAIAQRVTTTNDLLAALGKIGQTQPGSISKLNVFTHGSEKGEIVLSGQVTKDNVLWTPRDEKNGGFNDDLFEAAEDRRITFSQKGKKGQYSIDDVRKAFAKDASATLYACHSGLDGPYLKQMSDLLGVPVRGFDKAVQIKLDPGRKGRVDWSLGVQGREGQEVHDFHDLDHLAVTPHQD